MHRFEVADDSELEKCPMNNRMRDTSPSGRAPVVAVVGAAGRTGREIVTALAARSGVEVRAVVRSDEAGDRARAAGATSVARADLRDRASLVRAFEGATGVHVVPPGFVAEEDLWVVRAAAAASEAGAGLFGYHSVLHPDEPGLPHHLRKHRAELGIREVGIPWVVLRPAMYAQTALRLVGPSGTTLPFRPSGMFSPVDLLDLAEATATVLLDRDHASGTYDLAGPDTLSMARIVELVRGTPGSDHEVVSPGETVRRRGSMGWSSISDMAAMFAHYESHGLHGSPTVLRGLLGRRPTSLEDVLQRDRTDAEQVRATAT